MSSRRDSTASRQEKRGKPALKKVVRLLAREMIKKQVPKKVFEDCADIINKALNIKTEQKELH
jgi:hypothetical protein